MTSHWLMPPQHRDLPIIQAAIERLPKTGRVTEEMVKTVLTELLLTRQGPPIGSDRHGRIFEAVLDRLLD